jgi:hypothetical protein
VRRASFVRLVNSPTRTRRLDAILAWAASTRQVLDRTPALLVRRASSALPSVQHVLHAPRASLALTPAACAHRALLAPSLTNWRQGTAARAALQANTARRTRCHVLFALLANTAPEAQTLALNAHVAASVALFSISRTVLQHAVRVLPAVSVALLSNHALYARADLPPLEQDRAHATNAQEAGSMPILAPSAAVSVTLATTRPASGLCSAWHAPPDLTLI